MLVSEIMNDKPAHVSSQSTLGEALEMMATHKTRHVVVVDNDMVVGILSDRDLAVHYTPENTPGENWDSMRVRQVMSARPVTIGSKAELREAARMLLREAVSALPVVDNGKLVGLLSDREFTRYFARQT